MQAALKEIEKQIESEKAIVEQTRKMDRKDAPELENKQADVVDRTDAIRNDLAQIAPGKHNLFAYPAQSNFSGMQHSLAWVAEAPRTYGAAMEAWRSTCPRLSIWEDAVAAGLVALDNSGRRPMKEARVVLTARGRATLEAAEATRLAAE